MNVLFINTLFAQDIEKLYQLEVIQAEFRNVYRAIETQEKNGYDKMVRKESLRHYLRSKWKTIDGEKHCVKSGNKSKTG